MKKSEWALLEPTQIIGAFISWVALSILWCFVCLLASQALWGSLWGVLLGPVVASVHVFIAVRSHLRARQRLWEK